MVQEEATQWCYWIGNLTKKEYVLYWAAVEPASNLIEIFGDILLNNETNRTGHSTHNKQDI